MKLTRKPTGRWNELTLKHSDAKLVEAARNGDVESFRQLYERYYGMAVGIARSRLFDRHLAEDAAQEAFAVACRKLSFLRDTNRFPEWLGTICRRVANSMARSKTDERPLQCEPVAPLENNDDSAERVRQAFQRLSIAAQEVIQLHYFSGLSYEEIGRVLGITPQAVHGRLQRSRRLLLDWLSKTEETERTNG